jgi:hypothetical protein
MPPSHLETCPTLSASTGMQLPCSPIYIYEYYRSRPHLISTTCIRQMSSSSAKLRTIQISSLLNHDEVAIKTLLNAGVEDGFFYLDLRASKTQCLLDASAELTELAVRLFDFPKETLAKFDLDVIGPSKIDGYKPAGRNTGVAAGKQDGFEIHLVRDLQLYNRFRDTDDSFIDFNEQVARFGC